LIYLFEYLFVTLRILWIVTLYIFNFVKLFMLIKFFVYVIIHR